MKSFDHGTACANANLKGKKTKMMSCGCCDMFNPKEDERVKEDRKEINSAIREYYDNPEERYSN